MNALSLRPDGTVFDYFGGLADLDARCIRFVGDPAERIREDYLRILRFYRFAAIFGIAAGDPASRAACSAQAGRIETLSRERVGQEFLKALTAPFACEAVEAMASDGVLEAIAKTAWNPARFQRLTALEAALDPAARCVPPARGADRRPCPGRFGRPVPTSVPQTGGPFAGHSSTCA